MISFSITAAQTLQEILFKTQARGLQNLHRAVLLDALQKPLEIFEKARDGLLAEHAMKAPDGSPITHSNGAFSVKDVRAFQRAMDDLIAAQTVTLDESSDAHLLSGLLFAKMVVSSEACPALDGSHALTFKLVYDALKGVESPS